MVVSAVLADNSMNFNENPQGNAILDMLRTQRDDGRFCDIVLHVSSPTRQEKLFPAHRSVLAACSQYFESVLKTHRVTKEQINIGCHDSSAFQTILDYMYTGSITIDWNNVHELLKLSNHFLMSKVINYCAEFLEHYLAIDNCISVKDLADKYSLSLLLKNANEFISENLSEIIEQPYMIEMSARKLDSILSDPSLGFISLPPSQLLTFLVVWVKKDIVRRANDFYKLLDALEWEKLKYEFIFDHIDTEPLYKEHKICLYYTLKSLQSNNISIEKYSKLYNELCICYDDNQHIESETENLNAQNMDDDDDEHELLLPNSPIRVEPVEFTSITRSRSKATNKVQNTLTQNQNTEHKRRSERIRKTEIITPIIEDEDIGPKTRKRSLKQKYSKSEWITYTPGNKKKGNVHEKAHETTIELEQNDSELIKESNSEDEELEEVEDDGDNDESSQTCEDIDDANSIKRRKFKSSPINKKIQSASLAHWKEGVKCPHCIYVGHSATRLEQHLARVHEEDTTYKCKMCPFVCKWNREYYKHMKSHFDGPPYKCEDCDYSCDRIQFILSHRMRHTDERPYHCELCNFKSRTKGNLIVHMRIHTGEKPYKCQHCGRSFAMKNTLDQHLATHRDDRPFLCDSCGFTTKYQSHLLSHKRIHTGNVFHCQQSGCSYSSPRRSQLAAHMRSHLSIRSHICSTCGRAFIEKSHLIRHERIHLDEKPFKCEQCDYGSTRRDKLKEHVLKHHSTDGASKSPYKPRKPRRQSQAPGYIIEQSDDNSINSQSHLAIVSSSPQEIQISQSQLSDQELCTATASLIYEYASGEVTVSPARVVIQPAIPTVAYTTDGNQTLVERIVESQSGNNSARVVIQSIPSNTYSGNQSVVERILEQRASVSHDRNTNESNSGGNDLGGLNAFMALF